MPIKQTLASIVAAASLGLSGCGTCGTARNTAADAPARQVQEIRDGHAEFFSYLDSHDVQVVAIGEMHILNPVDETRVRREGIPLTIRVFTEDYLGALAERGYRHIVLESLWQESAHDLDMFYSGIGISKETTPTLYRNMRTAPAGEEVRDLLMRARHMHVRIHPGGMNREDIQRAILVMELQHTVADLPEAQTAINNLTHTLFANIATHTYTNVHNLLETNPHLKIVTYGGMLHNNTEVRQEALAITHGDREAAASVSFASRIQDDLARTGGRYREVDIVQRDILDTVLERAGGRPNSDGITPEQFLLEYILLTQQVRDHLPMFHTQEQQGRLMIIYGYRQR